MALRQDSHRYGGAIATFWIRATRVSPPASARPAVKGSPLKSNLGIAEEVARMASYLLPARAICCRNDACSNHVDQVPVGTARAYASFGKTAIGNTRWRCNVCGKTFSQNCECSTG